MRQVAGRGARYMQSTKDRDQSGDTVADGMGSPRSLGMGIEALVDGAGLVVVSAVGAKTGVRVQVPVRRRVLQELLYVEGREATTKAHRPQTPERLDA